MTKIREKASEVVVLDVKRPNFWLHRQSSPKMLNLSGLDIFEFCIGLGKFSTDPDANFKQGRSSFYFSEKIAQ